MQLRPDAAASKRRDYYQHHLKHGAFNTQRCESALLVEFDIIRCPRCRDSSLRPPADHPLVSILLRFVPNVDSMIILLSVSSLIALALQSPSSRSGDSGLFSSGSSLFLAWASSGASCFVVVVLGSHFDLDGCLD